MSVKESFLYNVDYSKIEKASEIDELLDKFDSVYKNMFLNEEAVMRRILTDYGFANVENYVIVIKDSGFVSIEHDGAAVTFDMSGTKDDDEQATVISNANEYQEFMNPVLLNVLESALFTTHVRLRIVELQLERIRKRKDEINLKSESYVKEI